MKFNFEPLEVRRLLSTTLYVDPSGSNGSGATAFTAIQAAANAVQAGDTVVIDAGNYAGFQMIDKASGTAAAPIVFDFMTGAKITSADSSTGDGIDIEGATYVTVEGATITNPNGDITRAGIRLAECDHFSVLNNTVAGMGSWGLYTSHSSYGLMQGNSVSGSINQHGIYIANSSTADQILDNTIFGNAGSGIHINGDASQGGSGIMTDLLVAGNIIFDNGAIGGSGINCDGVQDSVIENNLIYDNKNAKGICLYQGDSSAGPSGDVIINNTIIYPGANTIQITDEVGPNTIFNNILIGRSAWTSSDLASNNIVESSVPTGLFTDASANNYTLAGGSAAVGAGTSVFNGQSAPGFDILGDVRTGQIDIGAYQFGAAAITPPPVDPPPVDPPPVTDPPPQQNQNSNVTITQDAQATIDPVTGTAVSLAIQAADSQQQGLTYTWFATGPADVTFSDNGTGTANSSVATLTMAGNYEFNCVVTDPSGSVASSDVYVTVNQTLTSVVISSNSDQMHTGQQQQFQAIAVDQFSNRMADQPTFDWSMTGLGTLDAGGSYVAPPWVPWNGSARQGSAQITATADGIAGWAQVTVQPSWHQDDDTQNCS